jgi:hypothetical protein
MPESIPDGVSVDAALCMASGPRRILCKRSDRLIATQFFLTVSDTVAYHGAIIHAMIVTHHKLNK